MLPLTERLDELWMHTRRVTNRSVVFLLLSAIALPAVAQNVDSDLVGMWRLQWVGPEMFWQVRGDGSYRLIGTGARPNEHWGRIKASAGKWSSEWERGTDGGSYELNGNTWTVNGSLGPGTWLRVWPNGLESPSECPYLDTPAIEKLFANNVRFRMMGRTCEFSSTRVGIRDGLSITVEPITQFFYTYTPTSPAPGMPLIACQRGTNKDTSVKCIPGLGDAAVYGSGGLRVMYKNQHIKIALSMQPSNRELIEGESLLLAPKVLSKL